MRPNIVSVDGQDHRIFNDENNVSHPAASIETLALRRVFSLQVGKAKIIDFEDLPDFWLIDSVYISSPEDSEITIEILNTQGVPFYSDILKRHETPKSFPTVTIESNLKVKLTASRSPISLLLLYLKPVHLAYLKNF